MAPRVTSQPRAPTVMVRVRPQVLGDTLSVALEAEGIKVLRIVDDPPPGQPPWPAADLAVVTGDLSGEVIADTVIELDPTGHTFLVTREGQGGELAVSDALGVLLALVERLVGGSVEG